VYHFSMPTKTAALARTSLSSNTRGLEARACRARAMIHRHRDAGPSHEASTSGQEPRGAGNRDHPRRRQPAFEDRRDGTYRADGRTDPRPSPWWRSISRFPAKFALQGFAGRARYSEKPRKRAPSSSSRRWAFTASRAYESRGDSARLPNNVYDQRARGSRHRRLGHRPPSRGLRRRPTTRPGGTRSSPAVATRRR